MSAQVDVRAVLESAGADPHASEGSIGWALAQVDTHVAALIAERDALLTALKCALPHVEHAYHTNPDPGGSFWIDVVGCRNAIARATRGAA